jgi:hypothetical protein
MRRFKFFAKNEIEWRSATGIHHPLRAISTSYIENIMNCLTGLGNMEIPENYQGRTRAEWYDIFSTELKRRRRHENI